MEILPKLESATGLAAAREIGEKLASLYSLPVQPGQRTFTFAFTDTVKGDRYVRTDERP